MSGTKISAMSNGFPIQSTDQIPIVRAGANFQAVFGQVVTRATVDQSVTNNVVLASATNMSFAIAASEEWVADFDLDIGDAGGTTGLQLAVTVPASATLNAIAAIVPNAGGSILTNTLVRRTTTGGASLNFTTTDINSCLPSLVRVSIWVLNSTTPGTVQLQIAQSTTSGTAITLRKGSHMRANRVA